MAERCRRQTSENGRAVSPRDMRNRIVLCVRQPSPPSGFVMVALLCCGRVFGFRQRQPAARSTFRPPSPGRGGAGHAMAVCPRGISHIVFCEVVFVRDRSPPIQWRQTDYRGSQDWRTKPSHMDSERIPDRLEGGGFMGCVPPCAGGGGGCPSSSRTTTSPSSPPAGSG